MLISIETATASHEHMRSLAFMLLHIVGDLKEDAAAPAGVKVPKIHPLTQSLEGRIQPDKIEVGASLPQFIPPPPPPPPPPHDNDADLDVDTEGFGEHNTNFIPPPPPMGAASTTGEQTAPTSAATNTPSSQTSSSEYDASGMPWDARIHQKSKGKKVDGTWKIIKGINEKAPGLVESVVKELASKRAPITGAPPAGSVPPPPPAGSVPPPPPPPPPPPGNDAVATGPTFRTLVDKVVAASKAGQLTPGAVSAIVQTYGAPNLQALAGMAHLIPDVDAAIDAAILGV